MSTGYYNYAVVAYGSNNEVHFYCMQIITANCYTLPLLSLPFFIQAVTAEAGLAGCIGDPLQRLPQGASGLAGRRTAVRRLLPELGTCRRRALSAEQRNHGDQTSLQHVHVPRQPGPQTHLSRLQVYGAHSTGSTILLWIR